MGAPSMIPKWAVGTMVGLFAIAVSGVILALVEQNRVLKEALAGGSRADASQPPPPTQPSLPLPPEPVSIDGAPVRGDRNAAVALIEFSDFECPYCGRSARDVLPEIERQYHEGDLRRFDVAMLWAWSPP